MYSQYLVHSNNDKKLKIAQTGLYELHELNRFIEL